MLFFGVYLIIRLNLIEIQVTLSIRLSFAFLGFYYKLVKVFYYLKIIFDGGKFLFSRRFDFLWPEVNRRT